MPHTPSAPEIPVLNFIRDIPARADAFDGSHRRVAKAVAVAIHTQKDLKVIGLLGGWGSGKSTVVELAKAELERAEGADTHVFTYDAWLHQSDPPRRSFLERLIKYLLSRNVGLSSERWQARLDELNRRIEETDTTSTPTLTSTGKVALFLLLLLPFGSQFVSHDWIKDVFTQGASTYTYIAVTVGTLILLSPPLFAFGLYLKWRPTWNPFAKKLWPFSKLFWSWANWSGHKPPHENESIISLFMNKEVNRTRNRITRLPEPTAIEFQKAFREIMQEVWKEGRRFIFVIDNLDRLPETQAVAMWSTIRSFFLGTSDTDENSKRYYLPTVVLPVDETAVARMYRDAVQDQEEFAAGADLAHSFMEKTFDLTFRVTRPVLSDWKSYLEKQMKHVFGNYLQEDWPLITGMFIERATMGAGGMGSGPVTPRAINTHINRIGTLWLQWRLEDVSFAAIAYYAIFFGDSEPDIQHAVGSAFANIFTFDVNWRRSLAAIYYGCKPSSAMQILIEPRLRAALEQSNQDEFKELSSYLGFEQVLQRILDPLVSGDAVDPVFVLNAASLLDRADPPVAAWLSYAWRSISAGFQKPVSWQKLRNEDATSFAVLMKHCGAEQGPQLLAALAAKIDTINAAFVAQPEFSSFASALYRSASKAAVELKIALPKLPVPGTQDLFLKVLAACADDTALLKALTSKHADAEVVERLAVELSDPLLADSIETKLRALIARNGSMPWDSLINSAGQIIQDQDTSFAGYLPSLRCLGLLRQSQPAAMQRIQALFETGVLNGKLNAAHNQEQLGTEAALLALLLAGGKQFDAPSGQDWKTLLADRPELPGLTEAALREFDTPDNLEVLVGHAKENSNTDALIRGIVSIRVKDDRAGALHIDQVIEQLPDFVHCIDEDKQSSFLKSLADYDTFWETIAGLKFDDNVIWVLEEIVSGDDENARKAQELLEEKLRGVSTEQWNSALGSDSEPLLIAMKLSDAANGTFHLGNPLYAALEAQIKSLLEGGDGDFRQRWFGALTLVSDSSRINLLKAIRDKLVLGTTVNTLPGLLAKGGDGLLTDGAFIDVADGAVRNVIRPLIESPEGVDWLLSSAAKLLPWIRKSPTTTREFITDRLSVQWRVTDGSGKEKLSKLADAWDLPDLPVEGEETEKDKAQGDE